MFKKNRSSITYFTLWLEIITNVFYLKPTCVSMQSIDMNTARDGNKAFGEN